MGFEGVDMNKHGLKVTVSFAEDSNLNLTKRLDSMDCNSLGFMDTDDQQQKYVLGDVLVPGVLTKLQKEQKGGDKMIGMEEERWNTLQDMVRAADRIKALSKLQLKELNARKIKWKLEQKKKTLAIMNEADLTEKMAVQKKVYGILKNADNRKTQQYWKTKRMQVGVPKM